MRICFFNKDIYGGGSLTEEVHHVDSGLLSELQITPEAVYQWLQSSPMPQNGEYDIEYQQQFIKAMENQQAFGLNLFFNREDKEKARCFYELMKIVIT